MTEERPVPFLRKREHSRQASFLELFFDLAFIVTFSLLSQRLLRDFDWLNVGQTVILLAAIWWVWVATAWSTDWWNPNAPLIRGLVLGVMFLGLLMAAAIPNAFGGHGILFAGAYVGVHLGRAAVLLPPLRGHPLFRRSLLVAVWFAISAVPWLLGAVLGGGVGLALWVLAIAIDYGCAAFGWPVPRLGRLRPEQLRVVGEHLSERYRQIFIVALGEIVLVSGIAYAAHGPDPLRTVAFALVFGNAILLLWVYFVPVGGGLAVAIERNQPRGGVFAAYCHALMIFGTVVTGVGGEMMIRMPLGKVHSAWAMATLGGAALFLVGRILLGRLVYFHRGWRTSIAVAVLLAAVPGLVRLPLLITGIVTDVVLLTLVIAYWFAGPEPVRDGTREVDPETGLERE